MKRLLVLLTIMFCATATAHAQSDPLTPGLYEAESSDLLIYYTGAGWVQIVDGAYSVMESSEVDDSVSFMVEDTRQIVVYRELLSSGGATAEICIESSCTTFSSVSSIDQRGVPIAYAVTSGDTVTITNDDGGTLRLDFFLLIPASELTEVPAPDPIRQYVVLGDGTVAAVDQVITGGDILVLGFMAAIITALFVLIVVLTWHEGS